MRNASGQMKMSGSEKTKEKMNTGNKIFGKHIRQFLHKNNVYLGRLTFQSNKRHVVVQNNGKEPELRFQSCLNLCINVAKQLKALKCVENANFIKPGFPKQGHMYIYLDASDSRTVYVKQYELTMHNSGALAREARAAEHHG